MILTEKQLAILKNELSKCWHLYPVVSAVTAEFNPETDEVTAYILVDAPIDVETESFLATEVMESILYLPRYDEDLYLVDRFELVTDQSLQPKNLGWVYQRQPASTVG